MEGKEFAPIDGEAHRIARNLYSEAWLMGAAENSKEGDREKIVKDAANEIANYGENLNRFKGTKLQTGTGFSFSKAVEALKEGKMVSREGWNGKGMWLRMVSEGRWGIDVEIREESNRQIDSLLPWIGMKTADRKFVPWLASQTDILAEDWCILN